jgi:hypothetical protein
MALTREQRRTIKEIKDISDAVAMDYWNIEEYEPPERRSVQLVQMKHRLVVSYVIEKYTVIDEFLTDAICDFYFRQGKGAKKRNYRQLWKTKRFKVFVHYITDETPLLKKLTIANAITPVPGDVRNAITRINTVRNALAHSFFPENRRRYMAEKKVTYNGVHLFTLDGVKKFDDDFQIACDYLMKRVFG